MENFDKVIWQTRELWAWKMWQIICWFAGIWQRWGIKLTPSACYTRSSKQTLCVGLEVDKKAMSRNRYNRIPHPALNTKRERDTHNQDGTQQKQHKRKVKGTALSKTKEYSNSEGKKGVGPMTELLQVKWPKEVEPLLYFLIELMQNPNFYRIEIFASNFHQSSSNISSQYIPGFTFVDSFSAEIYKFD